MPRLLEGMMICGDIHGDVIRISVSTSRYFKYTGRFDFFNKVYFYTGDDLAVYELPILAPNLLTWWNEDEKG